MDGRPEAGERGEMLRHAVAHVALEAVARMGGAEPDHQPVARHLGDDRGGGDRQHQRIAAITASQSQPTAMRSRPSTNTRRGFTGQRLDGARQRPQRGPQDVVAVDARGRAEGDRDLGAGADFQIELFAILEGELLGIVEPLRDAVGIEDHGGGHHRPGERAAPGLVAAGDRHHAPPHGGALAPKGRADDRLIERQAAD